MGKIFLILSFKFKGLIISRFKFFINSDLDLIKLILQGLKSFIYSSLSFKKDFKIIYYNLKDLKIKRYYKEIFIIIRVIAH